MPISTVEFRLGDGTAAAQKRIVDDLLAKGVDGLAISPVDPANQTAMLNEAAAKALVFTHDSDAPGSQRECYVGTDNVAAGRQAGGSDQGSPAAGRQDRALRREARRAQRPGAAAGHQGGHRRARTIEIIDVRTDDTDQVRAKANVAEMLVSHPDVAALVGSLELQRPGDPQRGPRRWQDRPASRSSPSTRTTRRWRASRPARSSAPWCSSRSSSGTRRSRCSRRPPTGDRSGIPASRQIFIPTMVIRQNNVDEFKSKLVQLEVAERRAARPTSWARPFFSFGTSRSGSRACTRCAA